MLTDKTVSLDLGSGHVPRNPYAADVVFGLDANISGRSNVVQVDLALDTIPFPTRSVDWVTAFDFLEHVPRTLVIEGLVINPFIHVMNEVWRVLKPGGLFRAHTPAYPHQEAFQDPTHVNVISENTVKYFCLGYSERELCADVYGLKARFTLVEQYWDQTWQYHLVWVLKAEAEE